jgi:hypothetical protein
MANALQPFINSFQNKMNEMGNLNNQAIEIRLAILKQAFSMLLTPEGRLFIARNMRFRNVLIGKIYEFEAHPLASNDIQFLGISQILKDVIAEEQRLLNL